MRLAVDRYREERWRERMGRGQTLAARRRTLGLLAFGLLLVIVLIGWAR